MGLERVSSKTGSSAYLNTVYFRAGFLRRAGGRTVLLQRTSRSSRLSESAFLAGSSTHAGRYDFASTDTPDVQDERRNAARIGANVVLDVCTTWATSRASRPRRRSRNRSSFNRLQTRMRTRTTGRRPSRASGCFGIGGDDAPDERFDFLGSTHNRTAQAVYRHGLRIHTALDPKVQRNAERAMRETASRRCVAEGNRQPSSV